MRPSACTTRPSAPPRTATDPQPVADRARLVFTQAGASVSHAEIRSPSVLDFMTQFGVSQDDALAFVVGFLLGAQRWHYLLRARSEPTSREAPRTGADDAA